MDEDIERAVKACTVCQSVRNTPPHAPLLIPWKWPTRPFQRVHIDFCQEGKDYFLVVIDSHSKWIEVKHMTSTTTQRTLDELRLIFAVYGLPEEVVSDNGPQFTATEFVEFMTKNGIKHTLVPPYHPQSNGAAERSVRVVKEALAKQVIQGTQGVSMKHRLANFLLRYRTTPHSTTGVSPGELMMKRRLRTRLSLVKPDLAQVVEGKQEQQKVYKDGKGKSERTFEKEERVRVLNTRATNKTNKWILGTVVKSCGPRTYVVKCEKRMRRVHPDHMIKAHDGRENGSNDLKDDDDESGEQTVADDNGEIATEVSESLIEVVEKNVTPVVSSDVVTQQKDLRRSGRIRMPVNRFGWAQVFQNMNIAMLVVPIWIRHKWNSMHIT
ncbi:Transposon Ty3-I Gag-Pol poly, partial [Paramuricea clavata]